MIDLTSSSGATDQNFESARKTALDYLASRQTLNDCARVRQVREASCQALTPSRPAGERILEISGEIVRPGIEQVGRAYSFENLSLDRSSLGCFNLLNRWEELR